MNLATKKYVNEQLADLSTIDAADSSFNNGSHRGCRFCPLLESGCLILY